MEDDIEVINLWNILSRTLMEGYIILIISSLEWLI